LKGRVVVIKEYTKPFVIEDYEVPDPEPGAILLKITQAGICGSDLHAWRGDMVGVPLPSNGRVMGHEGSGVIAKLGAGVSTDFHGRPIKEGDRLMYACFVPATAVTSALEANKTGAPIAPEPVKRACIRTSREPLPTTTTSNRVGPCSPCRQSSMTTF